VLAACVVLPGAGLLVETAARYLAAAGVGCLRMNVFQTGEAPSELAGLRASLTASQPGLRLEALPASVAESLEGATLLLHPSFDDDPWLAAAVRAGVPAVFARATVDGVDVLSLRRHGPCPHVPQDRPLQSSALAAAGPLEVVAGTLAATEALRIIGAGVTGRNDEGPATGRLLRLSLGGGPTVAQDIPWSPACFACGGQGQEMSFQ